MRIFFSIALLLSTAASAELPPPPLPVEIRPVPLDPTEPKRTLVGRLRYLGGIEIRSDDKRIGGFSSLERVKGRIHAVNDVGKWVYLDTFEDGDRLTGTHLTGMFDLHGPNGEVLEGNAMADAEALSHDGRAWLVGFEHDHKVLRYKELWDRGRPAGVNLAALFGELEPNKGVETLAARRGRLFLCVERLPTPTAQSCFIGRRGRMKAVPIPAPHGLDPLTAVPVDADWGRDGTLYILMRSWSGGNDHRAAILSRTRRGELRTLATFVKPLTLDNYEGLALREEKGRIFLYMISDDNFRQYDEPGKPETWQRTLLMKFELVG